MDATEPTPRRGAICLVVRSPETAGGDFGRAAEGLARAGWDVHLLNCGPEEYRTAAPGVVVHPLNDIPLPKECLAANGTPGCGPGVYQSNLIRHGVEALHRQHHFRAIVFPSWQAAGFRCVQAKRAAAAFLDVPLIAWLDRLNQQLRGAESRLASPDDVFLDYCERYTLENADGQTAASADLSRYIQGFVLRTPSAAPAPAVAHPAVTIAVSHYNLGRFLPETLASLAVQTCSDFDVLVIDDGSTCADSLRIWVEQQNLHPQFRFIRQSNVGLGAARNRALEEAKGGSSSRWTPIISRRLIWLRVSFAACAAVPPFRR